jgi:predicted metalloprotease with PDZ domain
MPHNRNLLQIVASKLFVLITTVLGIGIGVGAAQTPRQQIKISVLAQSVVEVEIDLENDSRTWSFLNAYAGALGLGERIQKFQAVGISGQMIPVRKIASGEYRADEPPKRITYVVNLSDVSASSLPHISWIAKDHGFLMLADLLPEFPEQDRGLSIRFELPSAWLVCSAAKCGVGGNYSVDNADVETFFVGNDLRSRSVMVRGMELQLVSFGDWAFSEKDALRAASKVLETYFALTNFKLTQPVAVFLAPLPTSAGSTKWKAETRGSIVGLVMNPRADIKYWLGQLSVIFTHELLHLWVPNSLRLRGSYDWFFEGFTLYVALQTALKLKLIRFQEFLDTLARVYDSYLSYEDSQNLIEASESRWTNSSPIVYDRGMLTAFLYDLTLRRGTNSGETLLDQYRQLFNRFGAESADGNDVIIKLLTSSAATREFAKSYIENRTRLELESNVAPFGFDLSTGGSRSQFKVRTQLTAEQKLLLKSLGYRK